MARKTRIKSSLSKYKFSVIKNVFKELKKESMKKSTDKPIHLIIPDVEPTTLKHQNPTVDSEVYQCALNLFAFKNNLCLGSQLPPSLGNKQLILMFT